MDDENQDDAPRPRREAPIFKAPRQISRPKPPVQQEEMLGHENKMGDFEEVTALSVSEARAVVHAVHQARLRKDNPLGANRIHNDSQTINQFTEYLETFARFKSPDNLVAVSGVLEATNVLSTVEKAMLGMRYSRPLGE